MKAFERWNFFSQDCMNEFLCLETFMQDCMDEFRWQESSAQDCMIVSW